MSDKINVADQADKHFKNIVMEPTMFLAIQTTSINEETLLQLWHCKNTGTSEWRIVPDVVDFCLEHEINLP